jgi:hypothetical protein
MQVCTLQGHMSGVTCVQFRPDCKVLASCDSAGEVRLWVRDYDPPAPGSRPGSRGLEEQAQEGGRGGGSGGGSGDVGGDGSRANSMQSAFKSPLIERRRGRGGVGGGGEGGGGGASAGPLSILRLESPVRASSREDVSGGGANSQEASGGGANSVLSRTVANSVLSPLVRIDSPLTRRERELAAGTSSRGSRGGPTARLGSPAGRFSSPASASSCHSSDDAAFGASSRGQGTPPRLGTPLDTVRARQRWKALATSYAGVC